LDLPVANDGLRIKIGAHVPRFCPFASTLRVIALRLENQAMNVQHVLKKKGRRPAVGSICCWWWLTRMFCRARQESLIRQKKSRNVLVDCVRLCVNSFEHGHFRIGRHIDCFVAVMKMVAQ
jgi:hypothetical protein